VAGGQDQQYALSVNGDVVRDTWFLRSSWWRNITSSATPRSLTGYATREVDDLLGRVAAELDAGRPAGPLIENATFRRMHNRLLAVGYDIDAVDWFFDQLLRRPDHTELAGISADPWRDLAVAQLTGSKVRDAAEQPRNPRAYFAEECANAWRDFGQAPGMHLRWGRAGRRRLRGACYELRTLQQQTIASRDGQRLTVLAGGRSFTYKKTDVPARGTADSWPPGIAELAARSWRDYTGHYAAETMSSKAQWREARTARELVDETGIPILYSSGKSFDRQAYACVTFPDQRWLRFLVRGTEPWNAIMTAVDQAGNRVARYRKSPGDPLWERAEAEITVHPDQRLTDELVLAIAISAEWLESFFSRPSSGGAGAVATGV
jgi:hypothetical protein